MARDEFLATHEVDVGDAKPIVLLLGANSFEPSTAIAFQARQIESLDRIIPPHELPMTLSRVAGSACPNSPLLYHRLSRT